VRKLESFHISRPAAFAVFALDKVEDCPASNSRTSREAAKGVMAAQTSNPAIESRKAKMLQL